MGSLWRVGSSNTISKSIPSRWLAPLLLGTSSKTEKQQCGSPNGRLNLGRTTWRYTPRTAIKSQALVDFVNDWTKLQISEDRPDLTYWTVYFHGSRQLEGSGAGVVLISPQGDKFCYVLRLMFPCTNNAAEYEALLHGLRLAKEMNLTCVRCLGDYDLVAQQVSGTCTTRNVLIHDAIFS